MAWPLYLAMVTALVAVVLMILPNPPLTNQARLWMDKGSFFKFGNHDIFYIDEKGSNPNRGTVLIFHGYPTSSYDWNKILDDLKAEFSQVVMYDLLVLDSQLPGAGKMGPKRLGHSFTISEQTDIGEVLLMKLGVKQAHILSHDYGDTVALELLARHNQGHGRIHVLSLCLSNGGVFPETNHPRPIQRVLKNSVVGPIVSRFFFFKFFFKRSFGEVFGVMPSDEELDDIFTIKLHKDGNMVDSLLLNYVSERAVHRDRWVGALQTTKVPVHMIYGPADIVNPPAFIQFYKENVPNPSITVLKSNIGHYPQFEAPKDFNVPNPSITVLKSNIGHYPQFEAPKDFATAYKTFLGSINHAQ
ncbi:mesoderm-specific transcript protein-like [Ylistrum balloti]|uniref:mesoderm-specific transcript protein-like n=1 Tax=Ylistrum balloti TaxID=509963 RepID=UPI0029058844|nr:mesoderm-specific transcript protein-like [Ylistrum balloti]